MARVLLLSHNFPVSPEDSRDAGVLAYEVGLRLSAAGHEVLVLAPEQGEAQAPMPPLVVERFGWLGQGKKLGDYDLKDPRSMVKLGDFFRAGSAASWRMARRTKPDLVIAFWAFPCGVFARGLKAALGVPYAVWALGSDINSYYRPGTRALIREVLRGAALCGADGFKLCAQVERIAGRGCAFLPSARTLPAMPSALREGPVRRLLFVGRLEAVKGPDVLVEAFEEVAGELPELSLEVVGDGGLGGGAAWAGVEGRVGGSGQVRGEAGAWIHRGGLGALGRVGDPVEGGLDPLGVWGGDAGAQARDHERHRGFPRAAPPLWGRGGL
jgi:glycosyltransferase involved in cell wall biosynthesis